MVDSRARAVKRRDWSGPRADGAVKVWDSETAVSNFQVRVLDDNGDVNATHMLPFTQTRFTLRLLVRPGYCQRGGEAAQTPATTPSDRGSAGGGGP